MRTAPRPKSSLTPTSCCLGCNRRNPYNRTAWAFETASKPRYVTYAAATGWFVTHSPTNACHESISSRRSWLTRAAETSNLRAVLPVDSPRASVSAVSRFWVDNRPSQSPKSIRVAAISAGPAFLSSTMISCQPSPSRRQRSSRSIVMPQKAGFFSCPGGRVSGREAQSHRVPQGFAVPLYYCGFGWTRPSRAQPGRGSLHRFPTQLK